MAITGKERQFGSKSVFVLYAELADSSGFILKEFKATCARRASLALLKYNRGLFHKEQIVHIVSRSVYHRFVFKLTKDKRTTWKVQEHHRAFISQCLNMVPSLLQSFAQVSYAKLPYRQRRVVPTLVSDTVSDDKPFVSAPVSER